VAHCTQCGEQFIGEHWQTRCEDCYRDFKKVTVRPEDSTHPAIVYEREHPPEPTPEELISKPEHVANVLKELKEIVEFTKEERPIQFKPSQVTCEHVFNESLGQCVKCDIFLEQYLYSEQVPPKADIYEGIRQ
tara:strand:+ start:22984 stop:23382 length:399 start_codon:yes stop_codon:yes gene_type:complete